VGCGLLEPALGDHGSTAEFGQDLAAMEERETAICFGINSYGGM